MPIAPPPRTRITLCVGQVLPWPAAPDGMAQVEDLHRTRVSILYGRRGRLCRARVPAAQLARLLAERPLLPGTPDNPFCRGVVRRAKTFELPAPPAKE
jgi:hypothetical protein